MAVAPRALGALGKPRRHVDLGRWREVVPPRGQAVERHHIGRRVYDFAAIVSSSSSNSSIYTFGGDRETFNFFDPVNYLRIDNDVWAFGPVRHAHGVEVGAAV